MPRVGNKKSRGGCILCKARKVKCDEAKPSCGWCKAHAFKCEYISRSAFDRPPSVEIVQQQPTPTATVIASSPEDVTPTFKQYDRGGENQHLLELGLMQYYIAQLGSIFPQVDREYILSLHGDLVPQEALRSTSKALLYAMYAYALLHMHVRWVDKGIRPRNADFFQSLGVNFTELNNGNVRDKVSILLAHRDYLDLALQAQQVAIGRIDAGNADSTFLAAMLIQMIVLVHTSQTSKLDDSQPYTIPLQWFTSARSHTACFKVGIPFFKPDSAALVMVNSRPLIEFPPSDPTRNPTFIHLLDWQPRSNREQLDEQTKAAYQQTLGVIQYIHKQFTELELEHFGRWIFAFPSHCAQDFVSLLEQGRPRAIVMLAHLLAICKPLERVWWIFQGVADYHVRGIAQIVPPEWQWAMNWPLEMLEKSENESLA